MTSRQKAFADAYIELGNATQAAIRAGYSKKSAYSIGDENLRKPVIQAYIQERLAALEARRMASADEVMRFYTAVMRGEERDAGNLPASLSDRLKAADGLMKRFAAVDDRQKNTLQRLDDMLREFRDAVNAETN